MKIVVKVKDAVDLTAITASERVHQELGRDPGSLAPAVV
jgi:hypothetical protein